MKGKEGRTGFAITAEVPDVPPGRWCYQPKVTYQCASGDYTVTQTPACIDVR